MQPKNKLNAQRPKSSESTHLKMLKRNSTRLPLQTKSDLPLAPSKQKTKSPKKQSKKLQSQKKSHQADEPQSHDTFEIEQLNFYKNHTSEPTEVILEDELDENEDTQHADPEHQHQISQSAMFDKTQTNQNVQDGHVQNENNDFSLIQNQRIDIQIDNQIDSSSRNQESSPLNINASKKRSLNIVIDKQEGSDQDNSRDQQDTNDQRQENEGQTQRTIMTERQLQSRRTQQDQHFTKSNEKILSDQPTNQERKKDFDLNDLLPPILNTDYEPNYYIKEEKKQSSNGHGHAHGGVHSHNHSNREAKQINSHQPRQILPNIGANLDSNETQEASQGQNNSHGHSHGRQQAKTIQSIQESNKMRTQSHSHGHAHAHSEMQKENTIQSMQESNQS